MCIVDIVHKHDVLHNDLNPNNIMLHFPRDKEGAVFIGMCDWGMSTWINEEAPSYYGKESMEAMENHKERYNCAAPCTREEGDIPISSKNGLQTQAHNLFRVLFRRSFGKENISPRWSFKLV